MKILQLCKKFPFPLKDGESIAVKNLSKALHELGCEVSMLCMNTAKHYFDGKERPDALAHYQSIYEVSVDNQIKWQDAFVNLFSEESYHISRFVSDDFGKKLAQILQREQFDVIQLETLYLAPYIPIIRKHSDAVVAMRAHNVEHEIWERITENTTNYLKRWYLNLLTKKLKQYEVDQLGNYDLMIPITMRDYRKFKSLGCAKKSVVTPIGIDLSEYMADDQSFRRDLSLSFIGSLDWMPNIEGLNWFLTNVWSKLMKSYPELNLHVAGRNTPDWLLKKRIKNVKIYGEIPDAKKFINAHSIMIVPLTSGSGMRAKILEGMALGKVVISTSLGLEGIKAKHKKEVLIADTPEEFIEAIHYCYTNKKRLPQIGKRAQVFVAREYDNLEICKKLLHAYKSTRVEVY